MCRLEELLIQYPPEEVEAKRFQKIAAALGNRTPLQVPVSFILKIFLFFNLELLDCVNKLIHAIIQAYTCSYGILRLHVI